MIFKQDQFSIVKYNRKRLFYALKEIVLKPAFRQLIYLFYDTLLRGISFIPEKPGCHTPLIQQSNHQHLKLATFFLVSERKYFIHFKKFSSFETNYFNIKNTI